MKKEQELFFELLKCYNDLLEGKSQPSLQNTLDRAVAASTLPVQAASVWLKVKGSLALSNKDLLIIDKIKADWSQPTASILYSDKGIYTVNLAIYYAALLEVKNAAGIAELQQTITEIRDYVFEHLIKQGALISSDSRNQPETDMLLAVLPFGLFAPEDLIVVAGVTELLERTKEELFSGIEAALLGIYFTEKYDFSKAEKFQQLAERQETKQPRQSLLLLLQTYLQKKKDSLSKDAFIHKPLGNGNVYDTLPYERQPHYPQQGTLCSFRVQVNEPTHTTVRLYLSGIPEPCLCSLVDVELRIYEGQVAIPENYQGGSYYFQIETAEGLQDSASYALEISRTAPVEKLRFIGSTGEENIYQGSEEPAVFFLLRRSGIRITSQAPSIVSSQLNTECLVYSNRQKALLKDGTVLFTASGSELFSMEEIIGAGITTVYLNFEDQSTLYYGFGERYNGLNQLGNYLDCFVYNQYRDQGTRTYMPMPYYITDSGYGVFIDSDFYTGFDLQREMAQRVTLQLDCDLGFRALDIHILNGELKEMIRQFIQLSGQPFMLPAWALGPWMSSNNWDREQVVREQLSLTEEYQIPATVMVLEQWSDETTYYMFNDAQYALPDPAAALRYEQMTFPEWGRWPNPKGLIEECHEKGLAFVLWQIPIQKYLNQQSHPLKDQDEAYMLEQGFEVKNQDGTPYRIPENWFTDSLLLDFTNEQAKEWWFGKRQYLLDIGVDGFKTDGGEMVYGKDLSFADGSDGRSMRNRYPKEYIQSYFEFAQKNNGITFSRAGYTGAQTFPAHWAGDERSTFDAFKRSLTAGINAGMSGVIFWGWDLAGFNGDIPTAELYMRSASMAAFCPIMQYHAESKGEFNQDRTPWNIAERTKTPQVIEVYRYYANLRMNLLPYIYDQAVRSCENYEPLMRSLQVEWRDGRFEEVVDQYLFGEALLVAPVIEEGAVSRRIQLPEGKWTDFWTKEVHSGNRSILCSAEVHQIPVFIRENSALLLNLNEEGELGGVIGNDLQHYRKPRLLITADGSFKKELKDHLGNILQVEVVKTGDEYTVHVTGLAEVEIELIKL